MQSDQDAGSGHNVMRKFLPLVLSSPTSESHMQKWTEITIYLSNYLSPGRKNVIYVWVMCMYMHNKKQLQIVDIPYYKHEQLKVFQQPDS